MARNDAGLEPAAEGLDGSFCGTDQPVRYAVISAAAMGVEVWDVRPDARWRAADAT